MPTKLTKKSVEAVVPADKDVIVWDTDAKGFGLKVTPKGKRVYFLYYRNAAGQQRRPIIGEHGAITADQARQRAREWMANATLGGDISAERAEGKKPVDTVAMLCARYLKDYAEPHKKPRSVESDRANIDNHVIPLLGTKPVKEVTRADVDAVKLAIRDGKTARKGEAKKRGRRIIRGGEGVANRVVALLSKMFACAEEWGLRDDNPARGIRKFREHRNERFLSSEEVGRLLATLDNADADKSVSPYVTAAIRLLLFTGMRYGEVVGLTWANYDATSQCFRLADSKTGARIIPLSDQAVAALKGLPRCADDHYIFAAPDADVAVAVRRPWYRLRAAAGIDATANLHCLRHTYASWSVMSGLSLAQVGALLGHRSTQTTLRYADHALEALRSYSQGTGAKLAGMLKRSPTPALDGPAAE